MNKFSYFTALQPYIRRSLNLLMLLMMSAMTMTAQTPEIFETQVKKYIEATLQDSKKVQEWKIKNTKPFIKMDPIENVDMMSMYESELRTQYIQNNMQAYMDAYFGENYASPSSTISVCDNGGFEDDFLNYEGYVGQFTSGSKTCNPTLSGSPSQFLQVPMPLFNRFQIVTPGNDNLIPLIERVKFGDKALKLNNEFSHLINNQCWPDRAIDKIKKQFTVSLDNRTLTIWWSTVMQKPSNHSNATSFLNIKCSAAPKYDLCFDADFLNNDYFSSTNNCGVQFTPLVYSDWRCHTIYIPEDSIGRAATLEISMSDCAAGGHFGYAYIDGICEPCTENTMGRNDIDTLKINNYSCDGKTITVCGNYLFPDFCPDCTVELFEVPGFIIQNLYIDELSKSYCFEFSVSNFTTEPCLNIFSEITFGKNGQTLPPLRSNEVEICESQFSAYDYSVDVGPCNDNATSDNVSDDYYFVTINISDPKGNGWILKRRLLDPYPGETRVYTWATGSGTTTVELGPFLIQEGCWELLIDLPGCLFSEYICPPPFCSGCELFEDIIIGTPKCIGEGEWTFNLSVPGTTLGQFTIQSTSHPMQFPSQSYNFGFIVNFDVAFLSDCIDFLINYNGCKTKFTVCPPKKCPPTGDCGLEYVILDQQCINKETGEYIAHIDVFNFGTNMVCYRVSPSSAIGGATFSPLPANGQIGPFTQDVTVTLCSAPTCEECNECTKVFRLFKPDCSRPYFGGGLPKLSSSKDELQNIELKIRPNPVVSGEIEFYSSVPNVEIEIYSNGGNILHKAKIEGHKYHWNLNHLPVGVYIVKSMGSDGLSSTQRFVKL